MRLSFFTIDSHYISYLGLFDHRVSIMEKDKTSKLRPLVGVVFEIENHKFYAPLSSPKPKHIKMKDGQDFIKIEFGKLGVINLNNMIPVNELYIKNLDPSKLICFDKNELDYINLLNKQLTWCNSHKDRIQTKASKLFDLISTGKGRPSIVNRCCDFKLLCEISDKFTQGL